MDFDSWVSNLLVAFSPVGIHMHGNVYHSIFPKVLCNRITWHRLRPMAATGSKQFPLIEG